MYIFCGIHCFYLTLSYDEGWNIVYRNVFLCIMIWQGVKSLKILSLLSEGLGFDLQPRVLIPRDILVSLVPSVPKEIQAGLVSRDFALTRLENFHQFSDLRNNFRWNAIWLGRSVCALIFCRRLAENGITVANQSRVRIDYVCDIRTRLCNSIGSSCQNEWET